MSERATGSKEHRSGGAGRKGREVELRNRAFKLATHVPNACQRAADRSLALDATLLRLALWLADVAVEAATPAAQRVGTAPSNRAKTGSGRAAVMPPRSQRSRR